MTCQKNARTTGALTFIRQVISNETKNDGVELDKLKFLVRVCLHTKHTFPSQETTKYNSCNVQKRKKRATCVTRFSAEREGFEPPVPLSTAVFKTAVIDHSTTFPVLIVGVPFQKRCKGRGIF